MLVVVLHAFKEKIGQALHLFSYIASSNWSEQYLIPIIKVAGLALWQLKHCWIGKNVWAGGESSFKPAYASQHISYDEEGHIICGIVIKLKVGNSIQALAG